ncbi:hypothetical protein F5148DRAFT_1197147 [Russula earlei]|uniref:Uncharacterized protein n=1 Tax=Russula earlei TaxID=71964 RepID=A0ACC0UA71_9AGAM|nr:hypothetical protein F5148DRAFT_1197147 [Russula earlei]
MPLSNNSRSQLPFMLLFLSSYILLCAALYIKRIHLVCSSLGLPQEAIIASAFSAPPSLLSSFHLDQSASRSHPRVPELATPPLGQ